MKTPDPAWIPARTDKLLLDVATGSTSQPAETFRQWRQTTDWENAPGRIYCLLPSVYLALRDQERSGSDLNRLAGAARQVSLFNQINLGAMLPMLKQIADQNIRFWLSYEYLLTFMSEDAADTRPLQQMEIGVLDNDHRDMISVLDRCGWHTVGSPAAAKLTGESLWRHPQVPSVLQLFSRHNAAYYRSDLGRTWAELDGRSPASIISEASFQQQTLAALCLQGTMGRTEPYLNWIMDIHRLLNCSSQPSDWLAAAKYLVEWGVPWHGWQAFTYLRSTGRVDIDDTALRLLQDASVSRTEKVMYHHGMHKGLWSRMIYHIKLSSYMAKRSGQQRCRYILARIAGRWGGLLNL
ncbi:MAG: hypothetical protein ACM3PE_09290 [Deltaproteobacteria bacterium]